MIEDHLWLGVGPGGWAGSFLNYRGPLVAEGVDAQFEKRVLRVFINLRFW